MANPKYTEWLESDGLLKLEAWARDGLTDKQIASNMGITVKTLYEWKNKFSGICDALKRGKEVVDIQVENALFKRAIGYKYIETTKEVVQGELVITKQVEKEVLPDTTAQAIWLNNRKPQSWRRNPDGENKASTDKAINALVEALKK